MAEYKEPLIGRLAAAFAVLLIVLQPLLLAMSAKWSHIAGQAIFIVGLLQLLWQAVRRDFSSSWSEVRDAGLAAAPFLLLAASLAASIAANPQVASDHKRMYDATLALGGLVFGLRSRRVASVWWLACVVAALLMAGQSIYEVYGIGADRARGYHFWVSWGTMGLALGVLPLLAQPPGWQQGWARWVGWLGAAAGLCTAWLSGSRAVWLCAAILLAWRLGRRRPWLVLSGAGLLLLGATLILPSGVQRWHMISTDLDQFLAGNADTSLGLRLVMWREALAAWYSQPWLGLGPDGFHPWLIHVVEARRGPINLAAHGHAHNELLNALLSGGLPGALVTALLYLLPWRAFSRAESRVANAQTVAVSRAGKALILIFVMVGLTDTLLIHTFLFMFYAVSILLLLGWSVPLRRGSMPRPQSSA
ncbi:O-antigen ligase family protein [Chitinimonas sp.]|uniref:O-antigen ligase family protein n=1 Tax=Chitinimonas sp. TaxID=1934313 RepID=UPI0035AF2A02